MTGYELGFISKCAEAGLDIGEAMGLLRSMRGEAVNHVASRSGLVKSSAGGNLLPMVLPRVGETFTSKTLAKTVGKANPVIGPRSDWLRRMLTRVGELIGGGNKNARTFTDTIGRLQDKLAKFQAEGRLDAAKAIQHQIDSLRSTATHQGVISRWFNGERVGDQRLWGRYFGDVGSKDVERELNKVKWARRGGMAALAAPVALPVASRVLGGGGGGYDGGDEYAQYQQPRYGNVPVYR